MSNEWIQKIELRGALKIITTNERKYFIKKPKCFSKEKIYSSLEERGFQNFLKPITTLDTKEEVFPYIVEKHYQPEEKAIDMIHVLSLLQNKTTFYKKVCLDDIKRIYEENQARITYLIHYYQDLELLFLKEVYPSPLVYLFQKNISLLFSSLFFAQEALENWYKIISNKKNYRLVFVHHAFSLSHLLEADHPLLIHLDEMSKGLPIEDMLYFIKEHCLEQDIDHLFEIYQQKYPYYEEEYYLFACLLALPPKIEIHQHDYESCVSLTIIFSKMNQIRLFLLKQNEKYQKHRK